MIQITRLTKRVDFKTQMKVSLPSTILSGILGICLAYEEFGVWSLVWMAILKNF
ncbi:oligosaccharide flippase family protein [Flavobacteriaceae bacterium]|nr:oligosaccharide flippase family protein [Flavobacteriaceae bacterium]